jgi:glycosyltransferase-like protein
MDAARAPVALLTYSTKPRGGVVHAVELAEALHATGYPVRLISLGEPGGGFYRPVAAPTVVVPAPPVAETLEGRVEACTAALAEALPRVAGDVRILHSQDCIAARAVGRAVRAGHPGVSVRTVHHVDDFTSPVLMDCQHQAIVEPDVVLTVSRQWRQILAEQYGVVGTVVPNGVRVERFRAAQPRARHLRERVAPGRPLLLAVGGLEPRKGSIHLVGALARLVRDAEHAGRPAPVLVVLGGHSFQDHRAYRQSVLDALPGLGLTAGVDVVELGMVPDHDVAAWYAAADALAFPSVKEGFGLAVLEAMAARIPVVSSDLPVFREYLEPGRDALLVPVGDEAALAGALGAVLDDVAVRQRLVAGGDAIVQRFTWARAAAVHAEVYARAAQVSIDGSRPVGHAR